MSFHSAVFAVFLAAVLAAYGVLRRHRRAQNVLLLGASYVFYGWWDWRFLGLLALSTLVDFVAGARMDERVDGADGPYRRNAVTRRRWLQLSLATNLGVLGFFKYFDFFAESLVDALSVFGLQADAPTLHVVLPVGISFYTFQTLSYSIDVHRGRLRATSSLVEFALFVSFFPQLVAGPIERASRLLPQIARPRAMTVQRWHEGAWLVGWGLFKKVVIADNAARLVSLGFTDGPVDSGTALVAVYAFALQIYGDFSGYTDIARGCARVLGFDLMRNFDIPYVASNPSEFWRRWHISLSTWLRDYLYIPLGGSRGSTQATYWNLMVTMILGGLWHGAATTFVLWGAFHGALLAVHRAIVGRRPRSAGGSTAWLVVRRVAFFHLVCLGWVLFRAESVTQAADVLSSIVGGGSWADGRFDVVAFYALPLVIVQVAQHRSGDPLIVLRTPWWVQGCVFAALWFGFWILGEHGGAQFIYFQF